MNKALIFVFLLLSSLRISAQGDDVNKLPEKWTKDFIITLSFSGSMDGSLTDLTFTYDSCKYLAKSGMKAPKKTRYALKESDRVEILKKLRELKVDKINSETSIEPVNDGWSTSMCFGSHCVSDGTSAIMSEHDSAIFSAAYGYLEEFAKKKGKR